VALGAAELVLTMKSPKLFTVNNNTNKIDVIDLTDPTNQS
jgi:hypothetical protein